MLVTCWWFCRYGLALSFLVCSVGFVFGSMSSDASPSLDIDRDRTSDRAPIVRRDTLDPAIERSVMSNAIAVAEKSMAGDRWDPPCAAYRKSIRLGRWIAPQR